MSTTSSSPRSAARISGGRVAPGPRGLPGVGSVTDFNRDALRFILAVARRYGDVAQYRMGPMTWFQVNHPDGIQRVLQDNNRNYGKGELTGGILKPVIGNGLLTSEGQFWLRQRRLMQPVFHRQRIAAFGRVMVDATEAMLERWRPAISSGAVLDISAEMMRLTLDIVNQSLFSRRVGDEAEQIGRAISHLVEDVGYRFQVPFYPRPGLPTLRNLRQRAALRTLDGAIYAIINERRRRAAPGDDLLALLLEARDEETGQGMSDQQLRDEVITLYTAGHETTAVALSWTWYLLSKHPEAARRLRAELSEVLGGRAPTTADLPQLPYTRMVVEETMRLFPPVWTTNRQALAADEIRGFHIPAGAIVLLSPYVMQRQPAFWENPEGFDPQRFSAEQSAGRPAYAYFPFGGGPRLCIGKSFALVEAQLILASVAQRCQLDLLPGHPVVPQPNVTLRPRHGVLMTARPA